jgi:predicted nucleic acid-binding protein
VFEEVVAGAPRAGATEIRADWIHIADGRPELIDAFALMVDRGEAEALAIAKDLPDGMLVIDDQRARRLALELGLRFTGTLGILGMGKRIGVVSSLRSEIDNLQRVGFRISENLAAEFLRRSGE